MDLETAAIVSASGVVPLDGEGVTELSWTAPRLGDAIFPPRVLILAVILTDATGDAENASGSCGTDDDASNWGDWPAPTGLGSDPGSCVVFWAAGGIPLVTAATADRFRVAVMTPCEVAGSSARFIALGVYV